MLGIPGYLNRGIVHLSDKWLGSAGYEGLQSKSQRPRSSKIVPHPSWDKGESDVDGGESGPLIFILENKSGSILDKPREKLSDNKGTYFGAIVPIFNFHLIFLIFERYSYLH